MRSQSNTAWVLWEIILMEWQSSSAVLSTRVHNSDGSVHPLHNYKINFHAKAALTNFYFVMIYGIKGNRTNFFYSWHVQYFLLQTQVARHYKLKLSPHD